jgi:O-acetyl-ADP-ribose deacetylase (regulator of RNase III)
MSTIKASYALTPATRLEITQGDLTQEQVDAIVNAANERLSHGGGIALAIARAGGPVIRQESEAWYRQHGPVTHAEPAYTRGGNLPARYVIHAVGPVWGSGDEERKLAEAITGSLRRADTLGLRSIAIPAISTGIFGFPKDRAARVTFAALKDYFNGTTPGGLALVRLVLWDDQTLAIFLDEGRRALGR